MGGTNAGWVGEQTERKETDTPDLTKLEFPVGELYAEPWATQRDLDDSQIDIQSFISEEVGIAFAKKEAGAFITGNETVKPRGILSYDTVDNDNYAWGKLGFFTSGGAAGFADSNPADQLIDLVESLENGYQGNATLLMNRFTSAAMRKFKNSNGDYIWQQSLTAGVPSEFLGKPIEIDDFMPNIAAGSFPIAYGDFRQGYLITERMGTRMIRDEITKKSMVKFYNRRLVGGGVQNFQAIKLFKIAA